MSFCEIPKHRWPVNAFDYKRFKLFKSEEYLVQCFDEGGGVIRLSVNKIENDQGIWQAGISWDELQSIKSQIGYSDKLAVEIYPEDENIVNISNMRHLWVLPDRPKFAWKK